MLSKDLQELLLLLGSRSEEKRLQAMRILSESASSNPGPLLHALPLVVKAVQDRNNDTRVYAMQTLASLGPRAKSAAPALRSALQDESPGIRCEAAKALVLIGCIKDGMPVLLHLLEKPEEDILRTWETHYTLAKAGPKAEAAVPVLTRNLSIKPWNICYSAAYALKEILGSRAIPILASALENKDPQIRKNAADSIGYAGATAKDALGALVELLRSDKDPTVRGAAAEAIGKTGVWDELSKTALMAALKDPDPIVRVRSAEAIARLQSANPEAVKVLRAGLQSREAQIRMEAALALSHCAGPEWGFMIPDLVARLADQRAEKNIPRASAEALGRIGPAAVGALIQVLKSDDLETHFWAVVALEQIGSKGREALPVLLRTAKDRDKYEKAGHLRGGKRNWTILAVPGGTIGALSKMVTAKDKEAIPLFVQALEWGGAETQRDAAEGLGKIGKEAAMAIPALRELLEHYDPKVRGAARAALKQIRK